MTGDLEILPHPPGGRCMPNRCYCRGCPSYIPIVRDKQATAALAADITKNNAKHARSWAERDEPTWLDDK